MDLIRSKEIEILHERLRKDEIRKQEEAEHQKVKEESIKKFFRKYDGKRISHYIPCMHMPYNIGSSKLLIYFHANAEDIVLCNELMDYMRALLKINIIAVEYPGYGIYNETLQKRHNSHTNVRYLPKVNYPDLPQATQPSIVNLEANPKQLFEKTPRFGELSAYLPKGKQ